MVFSLFSLFNIIKTLKNRFYLRNWVYSKRNIERSLHCVIESFPFILWNDFKFFVISFKVQINFLLFRDNSLLLFFTLICFFLRLHRALPGNWFGGYNLNLTRLIVLKVLLLLNLLQWMRLFCFFLLVS